jgi:hypothetical protein
MSVQNLASVNRSRARGQSAEDKNGFARGLRVKQPVRSFRLVEIEPMRHKILERHFPVHMKRAHSACPVTLNVHDA